MEMNKELYRQAFAFNCKWDEASSIRCLQDARKLTPQLAWTQYESLWSSLVANCSPDERIQSSQKNFNFNDLL